MLNEMEYVSEKTVSQFTGLKDCNKLVEIIIFINVIMDQIRVKWIQV